MFTTDIYHIPQHGFDGSSRFFVCQRKPHDSYGPKNTWIDLDPLLSIWKKMSSHLPLPFHFDSCTILIRGPFLVTISWLLLSLNTDAWTNHYYVGVCRIGGIPKYVVYNGQSYQNGWWLGVPRITPILGNPTSVYECCFLIRLPYLLASHHIPLIRVKSRVSLYPIRIRMYAICGNIYHQYIPNVSIYTIHGSYEYKEKNLVKIKCVMVYGIPSKLKLL